MSRLIKMNPYMKLRANLHARQAAAKKRTQRRRLGLGGALTALLALSAGAHVKRTGNARAANALAANLRAANALAINARMANLRAAKASVGKNISPANAHAFRMKLVKLPGLRSVYLPGNEGRNNKRQVYKGPGNKQYVYTGNIPGSIAGYSMIVTS